MRHAFQLALALSTLQSAFSLLFPTSPIADTVYKAGAPATITWIDDSFRPHLAQMGAVQIDLYMAKNDTFLVTLARGVSAMSRTCTVLLPPDLTLIGRQYILHILSVYPPLTVYTADFAITPSVSTPSHTPSIYETLSELKLVLPTTTVVTDVYPASRLAAATTITVPPLREGEGAGTGLNRVHSPNGVSIRSKAKFRRAVFIVWPALIGVSMAL